MSSAAELVGRLRELALGRGAGTDPDEATIGDLGGWRTGLRLTTVAGLSLLLAAVALIIVTTAGPAQIVLAGIATLLLAADPRLGPLPAALAVMIAMPFGRGADTNTFAINGLPIHPQDAAVGLGMLCALPALRRPRREDLVPLWALAVFLAAGGLATLVGLVDRNILGDILRDARWWGLYAALGIALLARVPRAALLRGLLVGSIIFALAAIATTVLPVLPGGLKDEALTYDSGTLRMQFGNTPFLVPAIAFVAWRTFVRRSRLDAACLVLLVTALTLSLTRISIYSTFGMLGLIGVAALVRRDRIKRRPALIWAGILSVAVVACVAAGLAIDTANTSSTVGAGAGDVYCAAAAAPTGPGAPTEAPPPAGPVDPLAWATPAPRAGPGPEDPLSRITFGSALSDLGSLFGPGTNGRFTTYQNAIDAIAQSPIVGRGMGSLVGVPFAYSPDRTTTPRMQPGVDNAYLTIALKAGVIGLLPFIALLAWAALGSLRIPSLRSWLLPAWLALGVMTMSQSFAVSNYGPFGVALLMALTASGYTASKGATALSQV